MKFRITFLICITALQFLRAQPSLVFAEGFNAIADRNVDGLHRVVHKNGGISFVGYFKGTIDFNCTEKDFLLTAPTEEALFLAQYDVDGKLMWAKMFACPNCVDGRIRQLRTDSVGNLYFSSSFSGKIEFNSGTIISAPNDVHENTFFAKFNSSGEFVFAKQLTGFKNLGMTIDKKGNFYLGGSYLGKSNDYDPGAGEFYFEDNKSQYQQGHLAKYDANGNFVFAKSFSCIGYSDVKYVEIDEKDQWIYLGLQFRGQVDMDPGSDKKEFISLGDYCCADNIIAKLDMNGDMIWAQTFGGEGNDNINQMTVDHEGNLIVGGNFTGDADFDPSGRDQVFASRGGLDGWVAKYDYYSGNLLWAKHVGGEGWETLCSFGVTANNDVLACGRFNSVMLIQESGIRELNPKGGLDAFCMKLDAKNGELKWAFSFGSPAGDDRTGCSFEDANGYFYLVGSISSTTVDFDPGPDQKLMHDVKTPGCFFARYHDSEINEMDVKMLSGFESIGINVYPNPFTTSFLIDIGNNAFIGKTAVIKIYDAQGKIMHEENVTDGQSIITIDSSEWATGSYDLVVMVGEENIWSQRLIKSY